MDHPLSTDQSSRLGRHGIRPPKQVTVLIVEDSALIRMNAVQMIVDSGYEALEASNADDALQVLLERQDIRAVFTDINMSGSRSGLKLAHAISLRWPPIHLIITSGLLTDLELPDHAHFVGKPYENARVITLLHMLFETRESHFHA